MSALASTSSNGGMRSESQIPDAHAKLCPLRLSCDNLLQAGLSRLKTIKKPCTLRPSCGDFIRRIFPA